MRNHAVALCLFLYVLTGNAHAAARIVLLQPAGEPTPAMQGALQRIAAELRVEGYAPQVQPIVPVAPSVEGVEEAAAQQGAFGVLVLLHLPDVHSVRVLSFDGTRRTWVQRTLPLEEEGDAAAVLSIRAVEIMRAHFLERRYNPVLIERASPVASVAAPLSAHKWAAGTGAARMIDGWSNGVWAAHLWAAWSMKQWSIKTSIVPATTSLKVRDVAGAAEVSQQAAWLSAVYHLRSRSRALIPYVSVDAGVARLHAQGNAQAPYRGANSAYVTALFGAGVGCVWWAAPHWGLSLSTDMMWLASAASLQIDGVEQQRLGQPQFVVALGGVFSWGQGQ